MNHFNGSISPRLFQLRHLQYLDLSFNSLSGELPKLIGNLTKLQRLSPWSNKFWNVIHSSISYLRDLEEIDLSDNALSMEIPTHIGNLSNLSYQRIDRWNPRLSRRNNNLIGGIPFSIDAKTKQVGFTYLGRRNSILIVRFQRIAAFTSSRKQSYLE